MGEGGTKISDYAYSWDSEYSCFISFYTVIGRFLVVPENLLIHCRHRCPLGHNLGKSDLAKTPHFRCKFIETQRWCLSSDRKTKFQVFSAIPHSQQPTCC